MSVVITRPDGDRAILTFSGTMTEMSAADVPHDRLRAANHVHASSFFLQQGLQNDLPVSVRRRPGSGRDHIAGHRLGAQG